MERRNNKNRPTIEIRDSTHEIMQRYFLNIIERDKRKKEGEDK